MDSIVSLFSSGKYIPAAIVLAYGVLVWASGKFAWLKEGKRAAVVAGIVGGFATIAQAAATGSTPSLGAVVSALGAAIALYLHPVVQPKAAA
jgi:hypothetical protein